MLSVSQLANPESTEINLHYRGRCSRKQPGVLSCVAAQLGCSVLGKTKMSQMYSYVNERPQKTVLVSRYDHCNICRGAAARRKLRVHDSAHAYY